MPRKRKANIEKENKVFVPSKYQTAIFDFIEHGHGNLVVEAASGSGKTTTLLKGIGLIDKDKSIFLTAFNRDIMKTLAKKTNDMENVNVSTMHSLGLRLLKSNFHDKKCELDEYKYKSYINTNINKLIASSMKESRLSRYKSNVMQLVDYGRLYLAQTVKDLDFVSDRYGIAVVDNEKDVALDVMEWGKNHLDGIDYIDMIYLPNILNCKSYEKYDWICVDEAQDLSVAQRQILLKCCKINTRMVFFGDSNQTIYSFAGSDPESFRTLKEMPNTTSLPLSISYRCAKKIVKFAQQYVPSIEENDDGRVGEIKRETELSDAQDGDMILCRNNAPLMLAYVKLIAMGKKCFIRGKDIGVNLKNMVLSTNKKELNVDLSNDGVFVRLYDWYFDLIKGMVDKYGISYSDAVNSSTAMAMADQINALAVLSNGLNDANELVEKIDTIFSDDKGLDGIALSTIHKAKGLEADRVHIICDSLMPSKQATKDWEIVQEKNLMYVAYTRAKNVLSFVREDGFKDFMKNKVESETAMKKIEVKVDTALRREMRKYDTSNPEVAEEIIRHSSDIEKPKIEKINKLTGGTNGIQMKTGYGSFAKRKTTKIRKI